MRPSAIGALPTGIRALRTSCQAYRPSASTSANKDNGEALLQTGQLVVTRRAQLASLVALGGSALGLASLLAPSGPALATAGSPAEQALQGIKRDFVEGQYYVTGELLCVCRGLLRGEGAVCVHPVAGMTRCPLPQHGRYRFYCAAQCGKAIPVTAFVTRLGSLWASTF